MVEEDSIEVIEDSFLGIVIKYTFSDILDLSPGILNTNFFVVAVAE